MCVTAAVVVGGLASGPATAQAGLGKATSGPVTAVAEPTWARLRTPVVLVRSGGFAGAYDRIVISRSGAWTHRDLRSGLTRTGQLDRWDILRLGRLLDRARGTRPDPPRPACADGFRFSLVGGGVRVSYEECGQDTGPVGEAVHFILRAVAR
ncbi:hypothetical protein GCM10009682_18270 [Luedemannella flava]|uniref:Uncharacterized protein n=2 Tax=Luedemannella flava TaxID=349316 RepID=A0ABP4XZD8_9ACTN